LYDQPAVSLGKIIILDDSESSRVLVQRMLGSAGYQVIPCETPFSLSGLLLAERPDLVLVDVDMPALRGDKVVETVLRHELHSCVIVLYSARPRTELAVLAHRSGADGFICKNGDPGELGTRVAELLARRPAASQ
jgi:DNA-binding response OmpR family regulator